MPRREPISVEPDRYAFTASLAPGWSVDYWIVTTEGFRSARIVWPGDVPLAFTIDRGKNVIVNPVLKVAPTTPPLGTTQTPRGFRQPFQR